MGFKIAARALRQLGAELITSDHIALNELIKNSLDAKSKRVAIKVDNPFLLDKSALANKLVMTRPDSHIEQLALNITNNDKEILEKYTHYFNEGLVNNKIEKHDFSSLESKVKKDFIMNLLNSLYNDFCILDIEDQGNGMDSNILENAFLVIGTPNKWLIKDADAPLLGEKGVGRLSMMRLGRYASVISTVSGSTNQYIINFDWEKYNDPNLFLEDINIDVETLKDSVEEDKKGTTIKIRGLYDFWDEKKLKSFINEYLRRLQNPFNKNIKRFPIDIIFNGKRLEIPALYKWFIDTANIYAEVDFDTTDDVTLVRKLRWRGGSSFEVREWSQSELVEIFGTTQEKLKDLGSFKLCFLWFNRSDIKNDLLDYSISEVKSELNLWCGGYAIYRDNFRIGLTGSLEDDWLKADSGSLRSQGFSFNRYQTVGALDITKKENPKLVDAANREKLVNCEELDLLKDILTYINTKDIKSNIEFYKENEKDKLAAEFTAEETLKNAKKRLDDALKNTALLEANSINKEDKEIISEIKGVLKSQSENIRKYERSLQLAEEQRMEVLELAGLGMVVDKIVHELARMSRTTISSLDIIEKNKSSEDVSIQIKIIKEQIKSIDKRIRTVDTLSPSGRHRKETFKVYDVVKSTLLGFEGRFKNHNIVYSITINGDTNGDKNFKVTMVMGLLALALENLISNSIYWLNHITTKQKEINIDIDTTSFAIFFADNGPGIDPRYKGEIFKPYYSTSRNGKGLGLFISKEIAEYHQASIYLDPTKNENGRLNTFVLELPREKK